MQAIILAAGLGTRLGALTGERPKALVRVAGRELILRVFDFLDHPSITERIVVTGYESERMAQFLKSHESRAKTVFNPNFKDGSIRSIETALPRIKGEFLLMNADHIYPRRMIEVILKNRRGLAAVCDFDRKLGADDMKVKIGRDGKLQLIKKTLADFDCGYIGMTYCDAKSLPSYAEGVKTARKNEGDACAVECALGTLAGMGLGANICDASGMRWFEVDTSEDLAAADNALAGKQDLLT